jgi:outer membrane protein assembly factor BamB
MPRRVAVLLGVCACLFAGSDAFAQRLNPLVPETMANRVGLHQAWATQLMVAPGRGHLEWFVLQAGGLFAQTNVAMVQSLDPETGRTMWATRIGNANFPSVPVAANKDFVAAVNGSTLYLLKRADGAIVLEKSLSGSPSSGGAITADHVYVPMFSGALDCYKLNPKTAIDRAPLLFYGQGAALSPPIVSTTHLMWGTDRSHVYIDGLSNSQNRIRFHVNGPVTAGLAYRPPLVYAGSEDHYVYAIDESTGVKAWDYYAGSPVRHPPVVIGDALYVIPDSGGLTRLNATTGKVEWFSPGVQSFVAAGATRLYVTNLPGQMYVLDARTGSRLAMLPTERLTVRLVNTQSDRIYLATATGLAQCLREYNQVQPLNYIPQPKKVEKISPVKKKDAEEPKEEGAEAEKPAMEAPAGNDPFAK